MPGYSAHDIVANQRLTIAIRYQSESEGDEEPGDSEEEDEEEDFQDEEDGDVAGMRHLSVAQSSPCCLLHHADTVSAATGPPAKKLKAGPVSAELLPADEEEVEEEEDAGEDDGLEEEEDDEEVPAEKPASVPAPAAKAAEIKKAVVPAEDDLEEVHEVVAADEEDEE